MNMNENDNNFESLRRALALKRHEVPPPGYFDRFSGNVIARIRAGEAVKAEGFWSRVISLLQISEAKQMFAGGFASLLLLLGIVYAEQPEVVATSQSLLPTAASQSFAPLASLSSEPGLASANPTDLLASNSPINSLQPVASFFGNQPQNPLAMPVSFSPSGN